MRQSAFNQQQLDFISRKNAFATQQFDYADKFGAYNAGLKHFNESLAKFEEEKAAFLLEREALEGKISALEEEREGFLTEKQAYERQIFDTEKKNLEYADSLKAREEEISKRYASLKEREQALEERELAFHSARRQYLDRSAEQAPPIQQPQQPAYYPSQPIPAPPTSGYGFDYNDLHKRAQADGIRLNTAGTIRQGYQTPTPLTQHKKNAAVLFNKGAALFKAAFIVLLFVIVESLAVFVLKDYLSIPFWYPFVPLGIGFIFFIVCTFINASGKFKKEKRAKNPSYIITAAVLFVIGVILVTMVAVYFEAELAIPTVMISYIVAPIVYLLNIFFFSAFYYLFSKTPIENEQ